MTGPTNGAATDDPDRPDVDDVDEDAPVVRDLPEPATLDELADQVAGIAEQLEENDALVRTAVLGMARDSDSLKATVGQLAGRLEQLEPSTADEPPEPPEPPPAAWVDYASAQDWEALASWVDWLVGTYDLQPSRTVLPCWPAHRGVTEELAALRTAWLMAAKAGRAKTPNDALIYWHDRWLHPCLSRLRETFQYGTCVDKHKPTRPGRTADLDLLATALVAAAAGPRVDPGTGELS